MVVLGREMKCLTSNWFIELVFPTRMQTVCLDVRVGGERPCEVGRENNCRQCHKTVDATLLIHAVTTRRQTRAATDGFDNVVDPTTHEALADECDATAVPDSPSWPWRRRVQRRGERRVPPHASTDMADIAPSGWSSTFLAAGQSADDDLCQLKSGKLVNSTNRLGLKYEAEVQHWRPTGNNKIQSLLVNGVLYRQFHRGRALPDSLQLWYQNQREKKSWHWLMLMPPVTYESRRRKVNCNHVPIGMAGNELMTSFVETVSYAGHTVEVNDRKMDPFSRLSA